MTAAVAIIETPRTPAEAKRHWMIERLWVGSIFATAILIGLVGIVWRGGWSAGTETLRLQILAGIAGGVLLYQLVVVLSFSLGGPVGRWKARWRDAHLSAEDDAYDSGGAS